MKRPRILVAEDEGLAAMAIETKAIIATENVGHLGRYTTPRHWSAIVAR